MRNVKKLIHEEIRLWSKHYLEVRNKHLNGLPACPFARKSWAQNKVDIQIRNKDQGYTRDLHKHVKKLDFDKKELLIFCDVNYKQYSLNKFQSILIILTVAIIKKTCILWDFIHTIHQTKKSKSFY